MNCKENQVGELSPAECHLIDVTQCLVDTRVSLGHQDLVKCSCWGVCLQQSAVGEDIELPGKKKKTEKYPVTWYMERCLRDLVKRLVLPTTPKCRWASPSPVCPLGTSCLLAHHPSSCRDSWPLASCILPSGSLYIPSFPFRGLAVFSSFLQPCLLTLSSSLVFIEQL